MRKRKKLILLGGGGAPLVAPPWIRQCHRSQTGYSGADPGFDQGGGGPDCDRPKTAILGPQFCRILVLGPHFWWSAPGTTTVMGNMTF